jgi:hypothetical protein
VVVPGASVAGVVPNANLYSGHEDVMAVIVVELFPAFLTVIVLVCELNPT